MVTIIADNYFGYCKKEVKTQISFAANLYGMCEEEHAGGAIAFPAYVLGQQFYAGRTVLTKKVKFSRGDAVARRSSGNPPRRLCAPIGSIPTSFMFRRMRNSCVRESAVRWLRQNGEWHKLTLAPERNATFCPGAPRSGWKSKRVAQPGGWLPRARMEPCVTSHAPSREEVNRKFRNRSAASS